MSEEVTNDKTKIILERAKRAKYIRNMSGLSRRILSEMSAISESAIKHWEDAKGGGLTEKGAAKLVKTFEKVGIQTSVIWLMHGLGMHPQLQSAVYGAGEPTQSEVREALGDEQSIEKEISLFKQHYTDTVCIFILDDGMEPFYSPGDTVGGTKTYGNDILRLVGQDCIIETQDRQVLCRRLYKGTEPGTYTLGCVNPSTSVVPANLFNLRLLSVAPILRRWRREKD